MKHENPGFCRPLDGKGLPPAPCEDLEGGVVLAPSSTFCFFTSRSPSRVSLALRFGAEAALAGFDASHAADDKRASSISSGEVTLVVLVVAVVFLAELDSHPTRDASVCIKSDASEGEVTAACRVLRLLVAAPDLIRAPLDRAAPLEERLVTCEMLDWRFGD